MADHNRADTTKDGAANRGRQAHVRDNGEVAGSGASAGGGGAPEDFDSDRPAGGGVGSGGADDSAR